MELSLGMLALTLKKNFSLSLIFKFYRLFFLCTEDAKEFYVEHQTIGGTFSLIDLLKYQRLSLLHRGVTTAWNVISLVSVSPYFVRQSVCKCVSYAELQLMVSCYLDFWVEKDSKNTCMIREACCEWPAMPVASKEMSGKNSLYLHFLVYKTDCLWWNWLMVYNQVHTLSGKHLWLFCFSQNWFHFCALSIEICPTPENQRLSNVLH